VRKLGGRTLHSVGEIARTQRVLDNDAEYVEPLDMLAELREDNGLLAARLREARRASRCRQCNVIKIWIDETERRTWFLFEPTRNAR